MNCPKRGWRLLGAGNCNIERGLREVFIGRRRQLDERYNWNNWNLGSGPMIRLMGAKLRAQGPRLGLLLPTHIGSKFWDIGLGHFVLKMTVQGAITDSGETRRLACPEPNGRLAWGRFHDGRDSLPCSRIYY